MQWLFASYAQGLSTRDSVRCRRLIQSHWYQVRWGATYFLVGDQNQKTRFENSHGGHRIATSVGGSATGEGGDVLVVDDPHNLKEIHSINKRQGVLEWWDNVVRLRHSVPPLHLYHLWKKRTDPCHRNLALPGPNPCPW